MIEAWVRRYPIDVFPQLWATFEREAGESLFAPEEVRVELEAKDDELFAWAKARPDLFVPLDGEQMVATNKILTAFPRLVGALKDRQRADPFVIALAEVRSLTVVTEEGVSVRERPRIPLVCQHFHIRRTTTLDLIRELGLTF